MFAKGNKKGVLAIMTVIAIGAIVGILIFASTDPLKRSIQVGQLQNSAIGMYSKAQMTRNYMEYAAELSLRQAAEDLVASGESSTAANYEDHFVKYFNKYLRAYPIEFEITEGTISKVKVPDVDNYNLYDIFSYEYSFTLSPVSVQAFPESEIIDYPVFDTTTGAPLFNEDGSVKTEPIVVPTVITLSDPENGITYTANAYVYAIAEDVHLV